MNCYGMFLVFHCNLYEPTFSMDEMVGDIPTLAHVHVCSHSEVNT
jgi:hypothetical protein